MIEANEVRKGNYVYDTLGKVNVIDLEAITYIYNEPNNQVEPIPLTEEWLVRCGAETYDFDNGEPNQYRIGNRLFVIRDGKIVDYGSSVVLDYAHQLQNLYFALTSQELTIKEK